ncbi:MFS transporter, partial [bacterium]|nr:MFS transporter [bacterium]
GGYMTGMLLGLIAFMIAIFTTLFMPARDSIIPQLVDSTDLIKAGSYMQAAGGFAYFAGPVLAAAILPVAKLTGLFYADAATYAVSLLFLLCLRPRPLVRKTPSSPAWTMVKQGLGYARRSSLIRGLLLITAIDNLFIMGPALVGTPLYVRLHLGLGAGAYAAVQGSFAAGMIVGSFLVPFISKRMKRGRILLWAIIFDGFTFVPFLWADSLLAAMLLWFVHSIGVPFILVPRTTIIQTCISEDYQGRIFSMVNLTVVGLSAISCGLTGMAAEVMPVNWLFALIGVLAGLVGLSGWMFKALRETA